MYIYAVSNSGINCIAKGKRGTKGTSRLWSVAVVRFADFNRKDHYPQAVLGSRLEYRFEKPMSIDFAATPTLVSLLCGNVLPQVPGENISVFPIPLADITLTTSNARNDVQKGAFQISFHIGP